MFSYAPLPHCIHSPQTKEAFLAARPIINYRRFMFEKLLKATAIILQQMLQTCMPNTFGLNSLPHFFRGLSTFPLPVPVATRCRTHHPQSRSCRLFHVHPSTTHHVIRSSPSPPVPTATPTRGWQHNFFNWSPTSRRHIAHVSRTTQTSS